jgi:hypothetical protein
MTIRTLPSRQRRGQLTTLHPKLRQLRRLLPLILLRNRSQLQLSQQHKRIRRIQPGLHHKERHNLDFLLKASQAILHISKAAHTCSDRRCHVIIQQVRATLLKI